MTETALLESLGLRVQAAADADEALETLQEERECALVLLAVLMSTENTCDTIRAIRGSEHARRLQILVMGTSVDAPKSALFRAVGADGFLLKPVNRDQLKAHLNPGTGGVAVSD